MVSSWNRPEPDTFPAGAKAAGNYINAQLIKMEAVANGYADGIALGPSGLVSEGSGQNLFLIRDGLLITPVLDGTSLPGITRGAVLQIAHDLGIETREDIVPREALYLADELFFTGTATEVMPIRSVDKIRIGEGKSGPLTLRIRQRFMEVVTGGVGNEHGWLTYVS
jgi:branched-chain amino acid aminotransferase